MANLSPVEQFELIKENVLKEVNDYFPIKGKQHTLRVKNLYYNDNLDIEDVASQKQARLNMTTWSIPLQADLELVDNVSGKVIDTRKGARLLSLPKITREFSYIVNGQGRSVLNQFRLKSGIYAKRRQNGSLSTQFNLKQGLGFDMDLLPTGNIKIAYPSGGSKKNINLYPVLRAMNISDDEIKKELGPEVFSILKETEKTAEADLRKLHSAMYKGKTNASMAEVVQGIQETFNNTVIRTDTTKLTLGEPIDKVNGRALLLSAKKMFKIAREEQDVDDMENLSFKELWSAEDHIPEKIKNSRKEILRRVYNNLDRHAQISKIMNPSIFNLPIRAFFDQDNRSNMGDQTNIVSMIGDHMQTTLMGSGGISSEHQIIPENAVINKTHKGFLDPTWTPESKRTGVVLHLPLGVVKSGKEIYTYMLDAKTGKPVRLLPGEAHNEKTVVAAPNQFEMKNGKLVPLSNTIKARRDGNLIEVKPSEVDYIMPEAMSAVGASTAMIPFLNSNHGARVMMANKQISQAIPLVHREQPLVQSAMDGIFSKDKGTTIEDILGKFSSHTASVDGVVKEVHKDKIVIEDSSGKKHNHFIYDNYPLNDGKTGSFIDSTPLVKVGETIKKGQLIADTLFSKNGGLALGTNLKTAFMSSGGENFEDGVVISESAANKLTSEHLYRFTVVLDDGVKVDKKAFVTHFKNNITKDQADKLTDTGTVAVGTKLQKGDTIIAALKKAQIGTTAESLRKMKKVLFNPWSDASEVWNKDVEGHVTDVVQKGKYLSVYVRTKEPMKEGDKLSGRYGNKGIVVRVLPDKEMPRTKDGEHVEVLMNPTTVPTRINLGQVLEIAASKIAEKTGKRYEAPLIGYEKDTASKLYKELKEHGLSDREELFDPKTGKSLGHIGVGKQYILKMRQLLDNKVSVRGRDAYDINEAPKQGGSTGAQKMDSYGIYALLSHGARNFLREKQVYTSTRNDALWEALETGTPIPPPQQTFAWDKFENLLRAVGLNLEKKGNTLKNIPLTDDRILSLSNGEIKKPSLMLFGDKEEPGGLFDAGITGGIGGSKWSHFNLAEPVPNPVFLKPIRSLLGLSQKEFLDVATGEAGLLDGKVVPLGTRGSSTGGTALYKELQKIDVSKELEKTKTAFYSATNAMTRSNLRKKIRYLEALDSEKLQPTVYMLKTLPVLPPKFRPIANTDDGTPFRSSLNGLYKYVGMTNEELKEANKDPLFLESEKKKIRKALLGQVWKLFGAENRPFKEDRSIIPREDDETMGILDMIAGKNPKSGFFQDAIISKRQDLSMRGVITVGNDLELDEVGIPRKAALKIFEPFVKRELKRRGFARQAQDLIDRKDKIALDALQHVVRHTRPDGTEYFHPVAFKRDPALHKFSIMGYKVRLTDSHGIRLHPLSAAGFNADHDGDTMAIYVPVTKEGIEDVAKMLPSKNLFSATHGGLMHVPSQDAVWGLYELSKWGKQTDKKYSSKEELLKDYEKGVISYSDVVSLDGKKTTAGRVKIDNIMPSFLKGGSHLTDPNIRFDKGEIRKILTKISKVDTKAFIQTVQSFLSEGNRAAYETGRTVSLRDLTTMSDIRDSVLKNADKEVEKVQKSKLSKEEKKEKIIAIYQKATDEMWEQSKKRLEQQGNQLYEMSRSGARGSAAQVRQMLVAPMLVQNAKSETIDIPIRRSYAEGMDFNSYWETQHGARKGIVERAKGTQAPGALSKKLINSSMDLLISAEDCGTQEGLLRPTSAEDVVDRVVARDIQTKSGVITKGTLITDTIRQQLQKEGIDHIVVRSPLKCEHTDGICSKCFGLNEEGKLHPLGTNIGIRAGQSVGEPLSQGAMNSFHEGGVAKGSGSQTLSTFQRIEQLTSFPQTVPGAATLSKDTGMVTSIKKRAAGGYEVMVDGKPYITQTKPTVKVGQKVKKGDPLSHGPINPHDMMKVYGSQGIRQVQAYLTDEMAALFSAKSPIYRKNIETVVRSLTDMVEITDSGGSPTLYPGDQVTLSVARKAQKEHPELKFKPILKGAATLPLDKTEDFLARMNYEKIRGTLTSAATEGWKSEIHGNHPIPGLAWGKEFGKGTQEHPWKY